MKLNTLTYIALLLLCCVIVSCTSRSVQSEEEIKTDGSFYSGKYENLFVSLLGKSSDEVQKKINAMFDQFFYGDSSDQRIYYPVGNDMAYIEDILHKDVRSEGMSYGMMIAVQLDKKTEFDRLWKWGKTYMQHKSGPSKDYFAWQLYTDGRIMDSTSASDGEEWIVMSLLFASNRWGNGEGIYNYKNEAQIILDAMLGKDSAEGGITNMFNKKEKQVVFVPEVQANHFTDPSYHLPHYYELWGKWAKKNNQFWFDAADTSRQYLKKAANPVTGLAADYSHFDGTPYNPWGGGNHNFQYDAWRVVMNVAVDYSWFLKGSDKGKWHIEQSNKLLNFFYSRGIKDYGNVYSTDGNKLNNDHSTGLVAMNAVAALASTNENKKEFVEELWNVEMPAGQYRYYDSVLYMLGMLQVSGNFKIYRPGNN